MTDLRWKGIFCFQIKLKHPANSTEKIIFLTVIKWQDNYQSYLTGKKKIQITNKIMSYLIRIPSMLFGNMTSKFESHRLQALLSDWDEILLSLSHCLPADWLTPLIYYMNHSSYFHFCHQNSSEEKTRNMRIRKSGL